MRANWRCVSLADWTEWCSLSIVDVGQWPVPAATPKGKLQFHWPVVFTLCFRAASVLAGQIGLAFYRPAARLWLFAANERHSAADSPP